MVKQQIIQNYKQKLELRTLTTKASAQTSNSQPFVQIIYPETRLRNKENQ